MTTPVSLSLPDQIAGTVHQMAALERRSYAEMVQVLLEEALKVREHPGIYFMDGPTGRRARLHGGPDVWEILQPYLVWGKSWEVLRESFAHLDEQLLRTALAYYEAYPDEIEQHVAMNIGE